LKNKLPSITFKDEDGAGEVRILITDAAELLIATDRYEEYLIFNPSEATRIAEFLNETLLKKITVVFSHGITRESTERSHGVHEC